MSINSGDFEKPVRWEFHLIDRDVIIEMTPELVKCSDCGKIIPTGDYTLKVRKFNGEPVVDVKCQKCAKNIMLFEIDTLQKALGHLPNI